MLKVLCCGHMFLVTLTMKKLFYKKEMANQTEFRIEKLIKRKGDKLCIKWRGYDNFLNSSIDKKDILI